MDFFFDFFKQNQITIFDLIVLIILLFNLILSFKRGFILSLIYFFKLIIAFIISKTTYEFFSFYIEKIIENKSYALTVSAISVFLISYFLIILIAKAIGTSIKWTGLGGVDKVFGFLFGIFTGYFYCVILLSLFNYTISIEKWPIYLKNGKLFKSIDIGREFFENKILLSNEYIDDTKKKIKK